MITKVDNRKIKRQTNTETLFFQDYDNLIESKMK
jgi:hypothetical protein